MYNPSQKGVRNMDSKLISLKEYAQMHDIASATARQSAIRGRFKTARKIGNMWVIDKDEPFIDNRFKEKTED